MVLHCRAIPKCPERNLDPEWWDGIVAELNGAGRTPVIVGTRDDYLPVGEVLDLRGASLDDTISYLRAAKIVVGASSGPMHLAQACEAPVVVWSGNEKKDEPRYKEVWNHFDSPVHWVGGSWRPTMTAIRDGVYDAL